MLAILLKKDNFKYVDHKSPSGQSDFVGPGTNQDGMEFEFQALLACNLWNVWSDIVSSSWKSKSNAIPFYFIGLTQLTFCMGPHSLTLIAAWISN